MHKRLANSWTGAHFFRNHPLYAHSLFQWAWPVLFLPTIWTFNLEIYGAPLRNVTNLIKAPFLIVVAFLTVPHYPKSCHALFCLITSKSLSCFIKQNSLNSLGISLWVTFGDNSVTEGVGCSEEDPRLLHRSTMSIVAAVATWSQKPNTTQNLILISVGFPVWLISSSKTFLSS